MRIFTLIEIVLDFVWFLPFWFATVVLFLLFLFACINLIMFFEPRTKKKNPSYFVLNMLIYIWLELYFIFLFFSIDYVGIGSFLHHGKEQKLLFQQSSLLETRILDLSHLAQRITSWEMLSRVSCQTWKLSSLMGTTLSTKRTLMQSQMKFYPFSVTCCSRRTFRLVIAEYKILFMKY